MHFTINNKAIPLLDDTCKTPYTINNLKRLRYIHPSVQNIHEGVERHDIRNGLERLRQQPLEEWVNSRDYFYARELLSNSCPSILDGTHECSIVALPTDAFLCVHVSKRVVDMTAVYDQYWCKEGYFESVVSIEGIKWRIEARCNEALKNSFLDTVQCVMDGHEKSISAIHAMYDLAMTWPYKAPYPLHGLYVSWSDWMSKYATEEEWSTVNMLAEIHAGTSCLSRTTLLIAVEQTILKRGGVQFSTPLDLND